MAVFVFTMAGASASQVRSVTVTGSVTEETSGQPVARVTVSHDGVVIARSDRDGRFTVDGVRVEGSELSIGFQRIGFQRRFETVSVDADVRTIELHVTLVRFPTILEEITVDGRQVTVRNPGLIGFYERRAQDFGRYLTEAEMSRSLGFDLDNFYRRLRVPPRGCNALQPFVVFLDGIRVPPLPGQGSALERVNDIVMPGQIGGIEVYIDERASRLPREFTPAGAYCGVAMFWTSRPKGPSAGRFTTHIASGFGRPSASPFAIGGGVSFPLRSGSTLEFQGALQAVVGGTADRWRVFVDVSARPFGLDTPFFFGAGITATKPRGGVNALTSQTLAVQPTILTGFRVPSAFVQPFLELRIVDVFDTTDVLVISLFGIGFQFGRD